MINKVLFGSLFFGIFLLSSCAVLHRVQVGDLDDDRKFVLKPFEVKVSEVGVDFREAGDIAKSLTKSKGAHKDLDTVTDIIQLFQQGPRTGVPVFSDSYAENLSNELYKSCPSGQITGLISIREMRKYPAISGEIVKVKGFCMIAKDGAATVPKKTT
ncbi:MAG: hypothetical protein WCL28_11800 [bacterium]